MRKNVPPSYIAFVAFALASARAFALPPSESQAPSAAPSSVSRPDPAAGPWIERSNEYFRFVHKKAESPTVDLLMAASRDVYETVTGFAGIAPRERPVVVVYGSMDSPPFGGMSSSLPDRIALQAGQAGYMSAEGLLAHEFAHHMQKELGSSGWLGRVAGIFSPELRGALSLSYADLSIEGNTSFLDRYRRSESASLPVRAAVIEGRMWDWDKISSGGLRQPGSLRVYLSGMLVQDWLFDTYGPDAYSRVMAARDGLLVPLESEALKAVTGLDAEVAWGDIRTRLERRYAEARSYPLGASCTPRDAVDETQWSGLLPTERGFLQSRSSLSEVSRLGFWRPDPASPAAPGTFIPLEGLRSGEVAMDAKASIVVALVNEPEKSSLLHDVNRNRLAVGRVEWSADGSKARVRGMRKLPGSGFFAPCLSPDGKRLFASVRSSGIYRPVEIDMTSGSVRELAFPAGLSAVDIASSPDGSLLALGLMRDGVRDIGLYRVADQRIEMITDDEAMDFEPRFLADGRLAFSSDREDVIAVYAWKDGSFSREILDAIAAFQPVEDGSGGYWYSSYSASGYAVRWLPASALRKEALSGFASLRPAWLDRRDEIKRVFMERSAALALNPPASARGGARPEGIRFRDVPRVLMWTPEIDPFSPEWSAGARIDAFSYLSGSSWRAALRWHPDSAQASLALGALLSWPLLDLDLSGGQEYARLLDGEGDAVYAVSRYASTSLRIPVGRWRSYGATETGLALAARATYRNVASSASPFDLVSSFGMAGQDSVTASPGISAWIAAPGPRASLYGGSSASANLRAAVDWSDSAEPWGSGGVADISGGIAIGLSRLNLTGSAAFRDRGSAAAYLPRLVSRWNDSSSAPWRGELGLGWASSFLGNEWTDHMVLVEQFGSVLGAKAFWEADSVMGAHFLPELEFSLDLDARAVAYYFSVPARIGVAYRYRFGAEDVLPGDFCLRMTFDGYEQRF